MEETLIVDVRPREGFARNIVLLKYSHTSLPRGIYLSSFPPPLSVLFCVFSMPFLIYPLIYFLVYFSLVGAPSLVPVAAAVALDRSF